MLQKFQRNYSSLIVVPDNQTHNLLKDTFDLYIQGSQKFGEVWLNILGGLTPNSLNAGMRDYSVQITNSDDSTQDVQIPLPIKLFGAWFSCESKDYVQKEFIVPKHEIMLRWKKYLNSYGITENISDNWLKTIELTIGAESEHAVWVDRKESFDVWNKTVQFTEKSLNWVFANEDFPLLRTGSKDCNKYIGYNFSLLWGEGKKTDWVLIGQQIRQCLPILTQAMSKEAQFLDQPDQLSNIYNDYKSLIKSIFTTAFKPSPPSKTRLWLENKTNSSFKDIYAAMSAEYDNLKYKLDFKELTATESWHKNLLCWVEQEIDLPYRTSQGTNSQFLEMATLSLERLCSTKSCFFNHLVERYQLICNNLPNESVYEEVKTWFMDWFKQFDSKTKFPLLHERALNGLKDVCENWKNSQNWVNSVDEVEKCANYRFGDISLFKYLASKCQPYSLDENWYEIFTNYVKFHQNTFKAYMLQVPFFRHISHKFPNYPTLGRSTRLYKMKGVQGEYDYQKYNQLSRMRQKKCKNPPQPLVSLLLFDKMTKNFIWKDVNINCSRFVKEVLVKEGNVEAPRKHNLFAEQLGVELEELTPTAELGGVSLVYGEDKRFRLNLSANIYTEKKFMKKEEMKKIGQKYIGIDLGERAAATYSVWERIEPINSNEQWVKDENGDICKNIGDNVWVKLLEKSSLKDKLLVKDVYKDRFTSEIDSNIGESERNVFEYLKNNEILTTKVNIDKWKIGQFNNSLVFWITKYLRDLKKKNEFMSKDLIIKVYNQVFSIRSKDGSIERNVCTGGLTYRRIMTFLDLRSMLNLYLSQFKDQSNNLVFGNDQDRLDYEDINAKVEFVTKKINALRQERIRITVNMILKLAIKWDCKVVFMEDLTLGVNSRSDRFRNKRIDLWCPRRIVQEIKSQSILYNIEIRSVNPAFTSQVDFATGKLTPRKMNVSISELLSNKYVNLFKYYQMKGDNLTGLQLQYLKKWKEKLTEWNLTSFDEVSNYCKQNLGTSVWIPSPSGDRIHSVISSKSIDADVNGSCNVAIKGLKRLFESSQEFCTEEFTKKTKKKPVTKSRPKAKMLKVA